MDAVPDAALTAPPVPSPPASPAPTDRTAAHAAPAGDCASCGLALIGPYCSGCGEKRLDRHDYAFLHFSEKAIDSFTHLDVKVFRSLWSLLRRPGAMADDLLAGRRVAWAKPFQTFIIANLIFYVGIAQTGSPFFDASMEVQTQGSFAEAFTPMAEAKAAWLDLSPEAYAERYDARSHTLAKTGVVALVPVLALLLMGLFLRQRRYSVGRAG